MTTAMQDKAGFQKTAYDNPQNPPTFVGEHCLCLTASRICLSSRSVESLRLHERRSQNGSHHTEAESTNWLVATGCPRRAKSGVGKRNWNAVEPGFCFFTDQLTQLNGPKVGAVATSCASCAGPCAGIRY